MMNLDESENTLLQVEVKITAGSEVRRICSTVDVKGCGNFV